MQRADRRVQLLKVARNIVRSKGISALSVKAVADGANVAKTVVYSHFANSQKIAIALLDDHFIAANRYVQDQTRLAQSLDEYISLLVDSAFSFQAMSETPVRNITNGSASVDEVNRAFRAYEDRFQVFWSRLLEQLGLSKAQAQIAAYPLATMADNSVYRFAVDQRSKDAREMLKRLLIGAIRAVAPAEPHFFIAPSFDDEAMRLEFEQE